jgi:hypothetical protein
MYVTDWHFRSSASESLFLWSDGFLNTQVGRQHRTIIYLFSYLLLLPLVLLIPLLLLVHFPLIPHLFINSLSFNHLPLPFLYLRLFLPLFIPHLQLFPSPSSSFPPSSHSLPPYTCFYLPTSCSFFNYSASSCYIFLFFSGSYSGGLGFKSWPGYRLLRGFP